MTDEEQTALLTRLDERTETMAGQLENVYHTVFEGNGAPPLTAQVATLTERADANKKRIDALEVQQGDERKPRGDRYVIWAAVIAGAVSIIEMLLRHTHII